MTVTVQQLLNTKSTDIFSIGPQDSVFDAIKLMDEKRVGALLVMQNDQLLGIISERDYSRKVILKNRMSRTTPVEEIMTRDIITISPHSSIDECLVLMSHHHIRHLPVVENSRVCGILSIMDVVKNLLSEKEFIIEQLESYIATGVTR